jgi:hypothetical protein
MRRESRVEIPRPVREARFVRPNAEPEIVTTESGKQRPVRRPHSAKSSSGIFVICDGGSNVTDDNLEQEKKTLVPRVETEEGIVKEVSLQKLKAPESILRIVAGDSNDTVVNSRQP